MRAYTMSDSRKQTVSYAVFLILVLYVIPLLMVLLAVEMVAAP